MKDYVLVSDAALDLPGYVTEAMGIEVIPMEFTVDGHSYLHYPDERELSMTEFYRLQREGKESVTSQITPIVYEDFFTPFLKEGKDILYICFSSALSGTYQSAVIASDSLSEKYPDRRICCIDSVSASIGEGLLVYQAACRKRDGYDFDALAAWVEENRMKVEHWFTVEDLFHLQRGGRLSTASAVVGTALRIRPVLNVDKEGKLIVENKVRGAKKATDYLINKLKERGVDTQSQIVCVGHADNPEEAERIRDRLLEEELVKDVVICSIGSVIGTHVGSGMMALVFMSDDRQL